jgi:hypothetical protein
MPLKRVIKVLMIFLFNKTNIKQKYIFKIFLDLLQFSTSTILSEFNNKNNIFFNEQDTLLFWLNIHIFK